MKEQVINDVLLKMQEHITREQIRVLEGVLLTVLYSVEIVKMETALSTEFDDNNYMLDTIRLNMEKRDLSPKTIDQYIRTARNFLDVVQKNLRTVEPTDIEYYLQIYAKGKDKPNSPRTINNERQFLSGVYVWLKRCNFVTANPVENVPKKKVPKKPIEYLTGKEIELLRTSCDANTFKGKRERAILEFFLSTGARVGEVPDVKVEDIDFQEGTLLLYGHKDREYREVYINDAALVHIKRYLDARTDTSPYLFISLRKPFNPIKGCAYRDIFKALGKKIGRRIYPHLMRKTMATRMRQSGAPVDDISELLGHANKQVTLDCYAASNKQELKNVHRRNIA